MCVYNNQDEYQRNCSADSGTYLITGDNSFCYTYIYVVNAFCVDADSILTTVPKYKPRTAYSVTKNLRAHAYTNAYGQAL